VLGEIHAAAKEAAYAPFFEPKFAAGAIQDRRTRWREQVKVGAGTILLAVLDGRPLALSFFRPSSTRPGIAEIHSFYGHPDRWGSGGAAALMTEMLRSLRGDGFARAHPWTLRDTPRSRRFYTKCGVTETGAARALDFGDGNPLDQTEYERAC
jgi:GNAT superfamily N-acetyltransferase